MILRKVTNGFRAEWGSETYAASLSVVSTAKLKNTALSKTITAALAEPAALPG